MSLIYADPRVEVRETCIFSSAKMFTAAQIYISYFHREGRDNNKKAVHAALRERVIGIEICTAAVLVVLIVVAVVVRGCGYNCGCDCDYDRDCD